MAFNTKLKLIDAKFWQDTGDVLSLSGTTKVGTMSYLSTPSITADLDITDKKYVDDRDAVILASGKTYTDNCALITLNSGKTYTDNTAISTLSTANSYTDTCALITLNSGKTYTDNTVAACTITASNGLTKTVNNICLGGALTSALSFTNAASGTYPVSFGTAVSNCKIDNFLVASDAIVCLHGETCAVIERTSADGTSARQALGLLGAGGIVLTDANNSKGVVYAANYCANFTDRSLVDKAYVDSATGSLSANNGLSRLGDNIVLGGALTGATTISGTPQLTVSAPFVGSDIQSLTFDGTPTVTPVEGMLYYDNHSLNFRREISGVTLQIGEESVVRVENVTTTTLNNGSIVWLDGTVTTADLPSIALAQADSEEESAGTIGMLTHTLLNNDEGYITTQGLVRGVNTGAFIKGDVLWLSPTVAGGFTKTKPTYPNFVVRIGTVTKVGTSDGEIFVSITYFPNHISTSEFNTYTGDTSTLIGTKLDTTIYSSYTATTDNRLDAVEPIVAAAITGVTNGLTKVGTHSAKLGGTLTEATTISGANPLSLQTTGLNLRSCGGTDVSVNAMSNGGIYVKSQAGVSTTPNDFSSAIGIQMDYDSTSGFAVYDNRAGVQKTGIVYAADYSTNYVNRSLVDKAYVDSVATGLQAKAAALVATTANITLSGLQTVDGILLVSGNRVLVKDQTDATQNGIYVASASTWTRADDYDGNPTGEVANGDLIPVITGATHISTQWILTTVDPIVVGTSELNFSLFSQLLQIGEGNGIDLTTVSGVKVISVELSATNSGLIFDGTGLEVDKTIFTSGLTTSASEVFVNASNSAVVGTPISVKFGAGNALVVDKADFSYTVASNGLTKVGNYVTLGGALTGDTTITGGGLYDLSLNTLDSFNLGFDNVSTITDAGTNGGLRYAANYSANFVDRSLVDKQFVNTAITGSTLTFNNGLTKTGSVITWGGAVTSDRVVNYGSNNICLKSTGVDIIADQSCVITTPASVIIASDDGLGSGCVGTITVANTGAISMTTNNATLPILITSPNAIKYAADYSGTYTARSLPDVAWVTGQTTSSGIQTASNGLTKTGTNVELGGDLTGDTNITAAYTLNLGTLASPLTALCGSTPLFNVSSANECSYVTVNLEATAPELYVYLENAGGGYVESLHKTASYLVSGDDDTFVCSYKLNLSGKNDNAALNWGVESKNACLTYNHNAQLNYSGTKQYTCESIVDVNTPTLNQKYVANFVDRSFKFINNNTTVLSILSGGTARYGIATTAAAIIDDADLVNKIYVDTAVGTGVGGAITGATNGLTKVGQDAVLGGTLSEATTIIGGSQVLTINALSDFNLTSTTIDLTGAVCVTGGIDTSSTLNVTGKIDGNGALDILGATSLRNTLNVTGATTIGGALTLSSVDAGSVATDEVMLITNTGIVKKIAASTLGEDNNSYVTSAVTTTITLTADYYVVLTDSSGGAFTITLPAAPVKGQAYKIKDATNSALTNNVTISGGGTKLIDGGLTATLNTDGGALEVVYDGSAWFILSFVN